MHDAVSVKFHNMFMARNNQKSAPNSPRKSEGGAAATLSTRASFVVGIASAVALGMLLIWGRIDEFGSSGEVASAFRGEVFPTEPWARHFIDDASDTLGADGTRLYDVDGDGDMDVTTPFEEKGMVKVYINPGTGDALYQEWEAVIAGRVRGPEDSVLADIDNDGAVDVVSSLEGPKAVNIHWAPKESVGPTGFDKNAYLNASLWQALWASGQSGPLKASKGMSWMFSLPMDVDGKNGIDIVAGGKSGTYVGWFEAPENPRDLGAWKWHPLYNAGWLMSMSSKDFDGDGDLDVVVSPRTIGSTWLENPGHEALQANPNLAWTSHPIGSYHKGLSMFQATGDVDGNGIDDVVLANRDFVLVYHEGAATSTEFWKSYLINVPGGRISGTPKGAAVGDINLDGNIDIVFTAEHTGAKTGIMWMAYRNSPTEGFTFNRVKNAYVGGAWDAHKISGGEESNGAKFDLVELLDLDLDGDLDVVTSEEANNLGVVWYENPTL